MSFQNLTVLCHGRTINDDFVFPESEWESRINNTRDLIKKKNLDGLLLFVEGALTRGNVCYLTNYHQFLTWGCALLIFPKSGRPKLIMTLAPRDLVFIEKAMPPIVDYIPVGLNLTSNEHVSTSGIDYMRENGLLEGKRWGTVNLTKMPKAAVDPWIEVYPGGLPDYTSEFGMMRAVKSKNEIYALSAGSSIARTLVFDYLRGAKSGVNEMVLAADIDRQARYRGCESVNLLTYAGKDYTTMLRVPWDRDFEEGDTVSAFMSASYLRYNGAFGATTVIGAKTAGQDALFGAADVLFDKKIADMQKGSVITGYEEGRCNDCGADYYTVVNGVGMDLGDFPNAQGKEADILENMTFTVSLSVKKTGVGSVFISKNMLVTKNGIFPIGGFGI